MFYDDRAKNPLVPSASLSRVPGCKNQPQKKLKLLTSSSIWGVFSWSSFQERNPCSRLISRFCPRKRRGKSRRLTMMLPSREASFKFSLSAIDEYLAEPRSRAKYSILLFKSSANLDYENEFIYRPSQRAWSSKTYPNGFLSPSRVINSLISIFWWLVDRPRKNVASRILGWMSGWRKKKFLANTKKFADEVLMSGNLNQLFTVLIMKPAEVFRYQWTIKFFWQFFTTKWPNELLVWCL